MPPLSVEPVTLILLTGQSIQLTCSSEGVSITKLTWFKKVGGQDVKVPDSQVQVHKYSDTNVIKSVLKITNAKKEDGAGYKCVLSFNTKTQSKYATVDIKGKYMY